MLVKATVFIIVLYYMFYKDLKQLCDLAGMTLEHLMSKNMSIMSDYKTATLTGLLQASSLPLWDQLKIEMPITDMVITLVNM